MDPWCGRETSDIVYHDVDGVFTNHLVEKGYLGSDMWAGVKDVEYYVEVKTSTGACQTPFYMSKSQYSRVSCSRLLCDIISSGVVSVLRARIC